MAQETPNKNITHPGLEVQKTAMQQKTLHPLYLSARY